MCFRKKTKAGVHVSFYSLNILVQTMLVTFIIFHAVHKSVFENFIIGIFLSFLGKVFLIVLQLVFSLQNHLGKIFNK